MKNVVAKPLDRLELFIGEWNGEARHVAMPDTTTHEMRPDMSLTYTRATRA